MRIINVASTAHMMGKLDLSDLMREKSYSAWEAYGEWKEMQPSVAAGIMPVVKTSQLMPVSNVSEGASVCLGMPLPPP